MQEHHITYLKNRFLKVQNTEDLAHVLDIARIYLSEGRMSKISFKQLIYFAHPKYCNTRYDHFTVKKKNGDERMIFSPHNELKKIQRALNFILQNIVYHHSAATGFIKGKSIVDNANNHVGYHYVFNIDIQDFFHSFDRNKVKLAFIGKPFYFTKEREPIAFLLANLCTHPIDINGAIKMILPQGSPTSPILSNMLSLRLDKRLQGLANRFKLNYTRYADDISFSSNRNVFNKDEFKNELYKIIEHDEGLRINQSKIRLQQYKYRQEVTGLIVNEQVNVRKKYIKQIRMWLYYWEKYGYAKANGLFLKDYEKDKGHVKFYYTSLNHVLYGKLQYLKMVKGCFNATYQKLKLRYELLNDTSLRKEKTLHISSDWL